MHVHINTRRFWKEPQHLVLNQKKQRGWRNNAKNSVCKWVAQILITYWKSIPQCHKNWDVKNSFTSTRNFTSLLTTNTDFLLHCIKFCRQSIIFLFEFDRFGNKMRRWHVDNQYVIEILCKWQNPTSKQIGTYYKVGISCLVWNYDS